jgi:enoyl-CoA hydratase/carnithine racemase
MTSDDELTVESSQGVTRITLQRPDKGNCLSASMVEALASAVRACRADGTRLLVLRGAGRHFCTGFDLSRLDEETDDTLLARFVRVELLLQELHGAPFTTVALAGGRVMGAGADLFCACEQRWVLDAASFAFPGAAFGLVLGSSRLAEKVGSSTAREWIRTGATFDAQDALRAGLATRIVPTSELDSALEALAAQSRRLDAPTQAAIHQATLSAGDDSHARDLHALVLSAARRGVKERIAAYRASLRKEPARS